MRHYVIQERVDGGWKIVEHPADVSEDLEGPDHVGRRVLTVDGEEALGVERGPADEEGHDDGN